MKLTGKTTAELVAMDQVICADSKNRMPLGSLWIYTPAARRKLDAIHRAIADNMQEARAAAGNPVVDSGYSGRQSNKR